jgi:hypothetical protein
MESVEKGGEIKKLPDREAQREADVRRTLLHASTMGFVEVVVVGVWPLGRGHSVLGSTGLDPVRMAGMFTMGVFGVRDVLERSVSVVTAGEVEAGARAARERERAAADSGAVGAWTGSGPGSPGDAHRHAWDVIGREPADLASGDVWVMIQCRGCGLRRFRDFPRDADHREVGAVIAQDVLDNADPAASGWLQPREMAGMAARRSTGNNLPANGGPANLDAGVPSWDEASAPADRPPVTP